MNSLSDIADNLQQEMQVKLQKSDPLDHPGMKGDLSENGWIDWMKDYLPFRYQVTKGKVIDCKGNMSDQIDIIIHDRNFSSPILVQGYPILVPAESVYAVFECKPDVSADNIRYAQEKAESVRKLVRTSANIRHIDGMSKTENKPILAGILTKRVSVKDYETEIIKHNPVDTDPLKRLDLGCSASGYGFFNDGKTLDFLPKDKTLVNFLYKFLTALQSQGSVAGIEYDKYLETINCS